jgi:hypothetical protein
MANNPPSVVFVESGDVAPFPIPWGGEKFSVYLSFQNGRKPIYFGGAFYDFVLTGASGSSNSTCTIHAFVSTDQVTWIEIDAGDAPVAAYVDGAGIDLYYDFTQNNGICSLVFQDSSSNELTLIDFTMVAGGGGSWGTAVGGGPVSSAIGVINFETLNGTSGSNCITVLSTGVKVVLFNQVVVVLGVTCSRTWLVTNTAGTWGSPVMLDDFTVGGFGIWASEPLRLLKTPGDLVIPLFVVMTLTSGTDPRRPFLRYTTWTSGGGLTTSQQIGLPSSQYVQDGGSGFYDAVDDSINLALIGVTQTTFGGPLSAQTIYYMKGTPISGSPTFTFTTIVSVLPGDGSTNFAPILAEGDNSTGSYTFLLGNSGGPPVYTVPFVQGVTSVDRGNTWSALSTFSSAVVTGWPYTQDFTFPFGNISATTYSAGTVPALAISIPADADSAGTFTEFYYPGTTPPLGGTSYIAGKGNWILG